MSARKESGARVSQPARTNAAIRTFKPCGNAGSRVGACCEAPAAFHTLVPSLPIRFGRPHNFSCRLTKPCGGPPPRRRRHHRPPTEPTEAAAATRRPQHAHASSPSGVADGTRTRTPPCTCASTGAGARGTVCAMTMRRRHTLKVAVRRSEVAAARAWTALTAAYGPSGRRWPAGRCRRAEADRRGGGGCRRGRCSTSRFARS